MTTELKTLRKQLEDEELKAEKDKKESTKKIVELENKIKELLTQK
jgi:hypothetical protein